MACFDSAMNKKILIFGLLLCVLLVAGCVKPISEVKNDKYIDKDVSVSGVVQNSVKLGSLSGYTLKDDTGEIFVSSDALPKEGNKELASGILKKLPLIGTYYIDAK
jgi:hypothetical protein